MNRGSKLGACASGVALVLGLAGCDQSSPVPTAEPSAVPVVAQVPSPPSVAEQVGPIWPAMKATLEKHMPMCDRAFERLKAEGLQAADLNLNGLNAADNCDLAKEEIDALVQPNGGTAHNIHLFQRTMSMAAGTRGNAGRIAMRVAKGGSSTDREAFLEVIADADRHLQTAAQFLSDALASPAPVASPGPPEVATSQAAAKSTLQEVSKAAAPCDTALAEAVAWTAKPPSTKREAVPVAEAGRDACKAASNTIAFVNAPDEASYGDRARFQTALTQCTQAYTDASDPFVNLAISANRMEPTGHLRASFVAIQNRASACKQSLRAIVQGG